MSLTGLGARRRLLHRLARHHHTSPALYAKLLDSSMSIFPSYATTPPPDAPKPRPFQPLVPRRPPPAPPLSPATLADEQKRDLDAFLLRALRSTSVVQGGALDLPALVKEVETKTGHVLPFSLEYESTPEPRRRVRVTPSPTQADDKGESEPGQDGIVVVAWVVGGRDGREPYISLHSGFAVGGKTTEPGVGATILTCTHSLLRTAAKLNSFITPSAATPPPSASFVVTSSGHCFPVVGCLSAIPSSDIALFSLSPEPLRDPSYALQNAGIKAATSSDDRSDIPRLRTLPVSPYPAVVGTNVASLVYRSPVTTGQGQPRQWVHGRVIEYHDSIGRAAQTGTYDELAQMSFTTLPSPGSSGGPIVDVDTGAVVGVIRGTHTRHGDATSQGFATPSEKIFELFSLPGFEPRQATSDSSDDDATSKRSE